MVVRLILLRVLVRVMLFDLMELIVVCSDVGLMLAAIIVVVWIFFMIDLLVRELNGDVCSRICCLYEFFRVFSERNSLTRTFVASVVIVPVVVAPFIGVV